MERKKCEKCNELLSVISDIYWMARRYADNRMTYAPGMYNDAIDKAIANGLVIDHPDITAEPKPSIYARQG